MIEGWGGRLPGEAVGDLRVVPAGEAPLLSGLDPFPVTAGRSLEGLCPLSSKPWDGVLGARVFN